MRNIFLFAVSLVLGLSLLSVSGCVEMRVKKRPELHRDHKEKDHDNKHEDKDHDNGKHHNHGDHKDDD